MEMIDSLGISWQGLIVTLVNFSLLFALTLVPAIWIFFDARKRNPNSSDTWLWMLLALVIPLGGLIIYLLLGRKPETKDTDASKAPK